MKKQEYFSLEKETVDLPYISEPPRTQTKNKNTSSRTSKNWQSKNRTSVRLQQEMGVLSLWQGEKGNHRLAVELPQNSELHSK